MESTNRIETFIETEQVKYEENHGIACHYTPFCFTATIDDMIVGAISGATFFAEIYVDELVVKEAYRGKSIGTGLIHAVLKHYKEDGLTISIAAPTNSKHRDFMKSMDLSWN